MKSHTTSPTSLRTALVLTALLAPPALATGDDGVFGDGGGSGVPHVLIEAGAGDTLELAFDEVLPTPAAELAALFPQFAAVLTDATPTVVVAVGAATDSAGNPTARATEFEVPGTGINTFEFISAPAAGAQTGFLNDDSGFESEGVLPAGSDITVSFATVSSAAGGGPIDQSPFIVALGASLFTNIGDPIPVDPGFEVLEDGEVIDTITGATLADFFSFGAAFEAHPLFGLDLPTADAVGAALIDVTVSDANGLLAGTEAFRFLITNNPAAFQPVPEPAAAALLGLGFVGLTARARRRAQQPVEIPRASRGRAKRLAREATKRAPALAAGS